MRKLHPLLTRKGHQLAILSAEKLANPGMADLLAGLDSQCDVSVIFTFGLNFNGYRRLGSNGD
jgi:hypothetical protein